LVSALIFGAPPVQNRKGLEEELFLDADPRELFVGAQRLEVYLSESGMGWVVRLAALLKDLDYSAFVRAYQPIGRRAHHPRVMLGLVVYGIINRQWSLRELEGLARRDVGAWWVCGGHQPDHSTIGKFIQLHAEILSEKFFVELVKNLMIKLRLAPGTVAGDGTVIEAAASHYRLLRSEAMMEAARAAQAAADASPSNEQLARKAQAAQHAASIAEGRLRLRKRHGHPGSIQLSPTEPEAAVQPRKDGVTRPSCKPTAMVHESGLIVGQHVDPSSEREALKPMLDQHAAAFGQMPATLLLDAGFVSFLMLALMVEHDIDVLCPTGQATTEDNWQRRAARGGINHTLRALFRSGQAGFSRRERISARAEVLSTIPPNRHVVCAGGAGYRRRRGRAYQDARRPGCLGGGPAAHARQRNRPAQDSPRSRA
jgi:transposase